MDIFIKGAGGAPCDHNAHAQYGCGVWKGSPTPSLNSGRGWPWSAESRENSGSCTSGDGQFQGPWDVAFDSKGNAYIADFPTETILVFTAEHEKVNT